jgi:hypothetical protein
MALLTRAEEITNQQHVNNDNYDINYSTSIVNEYMNKIIKLLKK